jgi:murein DD-endopeptidase MepM/ murein hydrolase activator NlpD
MRQGSGFPIVLLLIAILGGFGLVIWVNSQPAPPLVVMLPTQVATAAPGNSLSEVMQALSAQNTSVPTVGVPVQQYTAPTLDLGGGNTNASPVPASTLVAFAEPPNLLVTPTLPPPTITPPPTDFAGTAVIVTALPGNWRPPALIPPISRDPLGRDHYYFARPADPNTRNEGLWYYPFGSDGQEDIYRVHHGIDVGNAEGEIVRAAGSGVVVWASSEVFQNSPTYGTVVQIQHDFGYEGQTLWTLYAHLLQPLVNNGDYVQAGDAIGLIGSTGTVSGPHVHFEVRWQENTYGSSYNPVLWMVPYEGHGTIAGRVVDARGDLIDDAEITIRSYATGLQWGVTTSYVYANSVNDVNADPNWQENFALGDVPVGRYTAITFIDGVRVQSPVFEIFEGQTTFIELAPQPTPTPNGEAATNP